MANKKPSGEELLKKAQAMLKKARAIKQAELQAEDISLGQLFKRFLFKEITLEELVAKGERIISLGSSEGGKESGS